MTPEREAQMREAFEAHWVESVQKRSSIFTRAHMTRWHDTGKYMAPGAEEGWQQWLACARALEPMVRDGERYRWLLSQYFAVDFDYDGKCALVFKIPQNTRVSADCDATIKAAMSAALEDGNASE